MNRISILIFEQIPYYNLSFNIMVVLFLFIATSKDYNYDTTEYRLTVTIEKKSLLHCLLNYLLYIIRMIKNIEFHNFYCLMANRFIFFLSL